MFLSAVGTNVSVNLKIGSVAFHIICIWSYSLHIFSYRGQSTLLSWYRVDLSPTVEFKLSRIMGKLSLPQRSSWTSMRNLE
jgi:hypothetical protein